MSISNDYETVNTCCIKDCMLDINRYLCVYKQVVTKHTKQKSKQIKEYIQKVNEKFVKQMTMNTYTWYQANNHTNI